MPLFARWRAERELQRKAAVFVAALFREPDEADVAWLAQNKPSEFDYVDQEDRRFWQKVRARPGHTVRDVRARFRDIDRRLADVEMHVTSQNRRLADEIEALR